MLWIIIVILAATTISIFFYAIETNTSLGNLTTCASQMEVRNFVPPGQNGLTVSQLAILYMLPLINFLFLSSSPYTIPFHQKLRTSDENGMHGFRMLLLSNFSALAFYSLIYLMVNLV